MAVGSPTDVDVVVVGQGAVAGAATWHLAREGVEVLLLSHPEVGPRPSEVTVSSRSDAPVGVATSAEPMWRRVEEETGASLLSFTDGVDHGDIARTELVADALAAHRIPYVWLDPDEAGHRWPGMVFRGPVLHQPGRTGRVRSAQAARALRAAAVGHGAAVEWNVPVTGVEPRGGDRVVLTTGNGPLRARRVVVAAGSASVRLVVGQQLAALREVEQRVAGFVPLGVNPCIAWENNWPVFVHHTGAEEGWPAPVHGTPDPCGDVMVAFSGGSRSFCPSLPQLRNYTEQMLPGLDAGSAVVAEATRTETADRGPVLSTVGPVVIGAGFSGSATPAAPALGRVLADMALVDLRPARSLLDRQLRHAL